MNRPARPTGRRRKRSGLTLLEAILSIAILGGAVAVIGEAIRVGAHAATDAREMTIAQLLCESKLAELTAGLQPLTNTSAAPVEVSPDWLYSVQVDSIAQQGLLGVMVTVQRDPNYSARPLSITLYRWLIDPQLAAQLEAAAAEQAAAQAEASSSSSSSSSGTTPNGTGGMGNG
jgi:type II secretion system protein I